MASESPQQISRVLVPNLDGIIPRATGNQMRGVKSDRSNILSMACKSSQENSRVLVPKLDGIVTRTTREHVIRVESHCVNWIIMASETSQQIARVLVPQLDTVVTGTTGEQISGVNGDWINTNTTVECFQKSIIYINKNNLYISTIIFKSVWKWNILIFFVRKLLWNTKKEKNSKWKCS